MVELARQDRDAQLRKAMTDAAREGIEQAYRIAMSDLITMAQEAYLFELARERKERRAVSGGPVNADVVREQQAITAAVKRGESERSQTQHNTGVGEGVSRRLNGDSQPRVPDGGNQGGGPMYSDRSLHSNVDRRNPEHLAPRVPNPSLGRKTSTRVEQEWMSIEKAREIRAEVQGSPRQQSSASSFNVRAGDYLPTSGSVPYPQPMPIPRSPDNHDVNGSSFSSGYRPKRQEKKSSLTVVPPTSIPLAFPRFFV
ncbi:hypothetical protein A0H81_02292 [Grifola frondosa]|uniref:Uncharacterized protein n=1 Tax=Grifola frondosa TaxID=5627 RepID=A0A1C7MKP1_GRIFR|nr:hypothetical protein A0H81_02292 [Grifola frondosa]